jgi:hypothetical protein
VCRLLKEMGWKAADYEECEITEDDMKEFQKLTKEVGYIDKGRLR